MRIVVNHLTRMQTGYICVAGIDEKTRRHVRPVKGSRFDADALEANGGPFDIATVVDIGAATPQPTPPEVEDHFVNVQGLKVVGTLTGAAFWKLLNEVAEDSLEDIFGPDLEDDRAAASVPVKKGNASLGVLRPVEPPTIYVDGYGKIRMDIDGGSHKVRLAVNDLRLYDSDWDAARELVESISQELAGGEALLSVGLGREWNPPNDPPPRHWLQVNNVHLPSNPAWKHE